MSEPSFAGVRAQDAGDAPSGAAAPESRRLPSVDAVLKTDAARAARDRHGRAAA
ncbi:hypothetical protein V5F33_19880, partial [Xanthobacter tagetidis]